MIVELGYFAVLRALGILAMFALLGPPIGGLVAWGMMGARDFRSPVPFLLGSYAEGLAAALVAGFIVAVAAVWLGQTAWPIPVAAAFVAAAVPVLLPIARSEEVPALSNVMRAGWVFLPPSLVASLACWFLSRRMYRKREM
jgi:hypothetical protein